MGFYSCGEPPPAGIFVFLPASVAFTLKALGMHRTKKTTKDLPLLQSRACAAPTIALWLQFYANLRLMVVWAVVPVPHSRFCRSHKILSPAYRYRLPPCFLRLLMLSAIGIKAPGVRYLWM